MPAKTKVLFICGHNSARSQMAEAYLKALDKEGRFTVESAGLDPRPVNPLVVEAMAEEGVDLSAKGSQSAFSLYRQGRIFDFVITVCDAETDRACPVFPGVTHRVNVPFADPAAARGGHAEQLAYVRGIRDQIKAWVERFVAQAEQGLSGRLG